MYNRIQKKGEIGSVMVTTLNHRLENINYSYEVVPIVCT